MTVIEYAGKLGIDLTDSQKGILNIWQESDNESAMLVLAMQRCNGRQMIYDLIQRYKGYEQGRAEERAEIQSELMDEVCMLGVTKMTKEDLMCFAYRIKDIAEQMKELKNENTN